MNKKNIIKFFLIGIVVLCVGYFMYLSKIEGFQTTTTNQCGFFYFNKSLTQRVKTYVCPTAAAVTALGPMTGTDVAYVTPCVSVAVGGIVHWNCPPNPPNGSRNYPSELVDTSGNSIPPFVKPTDMVCFTYDLSGGVYFCKDRYSGNMYDDYTGTLSANKDTTCQGLQKALVDISGNIADLVRLKTNTQLTWQTLKAARDNLNTMYVSHNCGAATGNASTICAIIKNGATSIGGNFTDLDTLYSKTANPEVQLAQMKVNITTALQQFRCR